MPTLWRQKLHRLSTVLIVIQGVLAILLSWNAPIRAWWYGKRLEGDRTLIGLLNTYIYKTVSFCGPYFVAAYNNDRKRMRQISWIQFFIAIILKVVAIWEWYSGQSHSMELLYVGLALSAMSLLTLVVVDAEVEFEKVEERKRQAESEEEREQLELNASVNAYTPNYWDRDLGNAVAGHATASDHNNHRYSTLPPHERVQAVAETEKEKAD